jgi:hypothetical protein
MTVIVIGDVPKKQYIDCIYAYILVSLHLRVPVTVKILHLATNFKCLQMANSHRCLVLS